MVALLYSFVTGDEASKVSNNLLDSVNAFSILLFSSESFIIDSSLFDYLTL